MKRSASLINGPLTRLAVVSVFVACVGCGGSDDSEGGAAGAGGLPASGGSTSGGAAGGGAAAGAGGAAGGGATAGAAGAAGGGATAGAAGGGAAAGSSGSAGNGGTPSGSGTLIFFDDFEKAVLKQPPTKDKIDAPAGYGWWGNCSGNCTEVSAEQSRSGGRALKSYLNRLTSNVSYRTEAVPRGEARDNVLEGVDYWYGMSVFVPVGHQTDALSGDTVVQWHHGSGATPGCSSGGNPPLHLRIAGTNWVVRAKASPDVVNDCKRTDKIVFEKDLGAVTKGGWTDWVFHVVWSPKADGRLEVWMNGKLVVDYSGPTDYGNAGGSWMKLGLYKTAWRKPPNGKNYDANIVERTFFHDNVRIAKGKGSLYGLVDPSK